MDALPVISDPQETLGYLSEAAGVSGREEEVRRRIAALLQGRVDDLRVDALGNLIAVKGRGKPGPRVMLAAHMDEIGFLVSGADDDGLLRFKKVGGIDDRILPGRRVIVGREGIAGVITAKPVHLQKRDEKERVVPADELRIDVGAAGREEAERVAPPGTPAVFHTSFGPLGRSRVKGRAFDDRAGCTVLVHTLLSDFPTEVVGVFTVQEEIGLRGAGVAAYAVEPDLALALEGTGAADIPGPSEAERSTALGAGPAITFMDRATLPPRQLVEELVRAAQELGIPWQWRRATVGGTDAGRIHQTKAGVPAGTVSVPCRYIHSPCAVLDLGDLKHTITLVRGFLERAPSWRRTG